MSGGIGEGAKKVERGDGEFIRGCIYHEIGFFATQASRMIV